MPSSYKELRVLRAAATGPRIVAAHPPLAAETCQRLDLADPLPAVDRQLLAASQDQVDPGAFLCLRCHVSHALEQKARELAANFGQQHGVRLEDVASFALHDDGNDGRTRLTYASFDGKDPDTILPFTAQVICSFDPDRGAGLPHWARQRLRGYQPLKDFLRDLHGVLLISPWALLADSSPTRVRDAWLCASPADRTILSLDQVLALHAAYRNGYRQDRQEHRRLLHRSGGYRPSESFLRSLAPDQALATTYSQLMELDKAIRHYLTPNWRGKLQQQSDAEPLEQLADPRAFDAGIEAAWSPAEQLALIDAALLRALDRLMPAVLASAAGQQRLQCFWRGFAAGLSSRAIADRCDSNQPAVSRALNVRQRAASVALAAAEELKRHPAFRSLGTSIEAAERMQNALAHHLLSAEQKKSGSPLQQWILRHLSPQ